MWLDAPIGYIASHEALCRENGDDFDAYWLPGGDTELYHFIGKDIVNFHGLFWPAMLDSAGLRQPTAVYAHGFLTVNGVKMSKAEARLSSLKLISSTSTPSTCGTTSPPSSPRVSMTLTSTSMISCSA